MTGVRQARCDIVAATRLGRQGSPSFHSIHAEKIAGDDEVTHRDLAPARPQSDLFNRTTVLAEIQRTLPVQLCRQPALASPNREESPVLRIDVAVPDHGFLRHCDKPRPAFKIRQATGNVADPQLAPGSSTGTGILDSNEVSTSQRSRYQDAERDSSTLERGPALQAKLLARDQTATWPVWRSLNRRSRGTTAGT